MSASGQREAVFATRQTLGNTKSRLKGAQNGHSLLKRKADALSKRFRDITSKIQEAKQQMGKVLQLASFSMVEVGYATGDIGYAVRENVKSASFRVRARQENISGVHLPSFTIQNGSNEDSNQQDSEQDKTSAGPQEFNLTGLSRGGQQVQKARDTYRKALKVLVDLASLQTAFVILDEVIRLTNRRVNAIEHVIIPRLENTIAVRHNLDSHPVYYLGIGRNGPVGDFWSDHSEEFFRLKKVQGKKKREAAADSKSDPSLENEDVNSVQKVEISMDKASGDLVSDEQDNDVIF